MKILGEQDEKQKKRHFDVQTDKQETIKNSSWLYEANESLVKYACSRYEECR